MSPEGTIAKPVKDLASAIRVMVVDDSAVIRGLVTSMLEADTHIQVVASCANGAIALQTVNRVDPDVVILDVEMPVMDGITALPKILEARPGTSIIIASTLSQRNAEISLQALALGAADYVPKPVASRIGSNEEFRRELLDKVRLFGNRSRARRPRTETLHVHTPVAVKAPPRPRETPVITLRRPGLLRPNVLAIASSTGGPQALNVLLKNIPTSINVPIVITQHMPPTFTSILAQHVAKASGWPCHEAVEGETIQAGTIYVAPGDKHLTFEKQGTGAKVRLSSDPPENFCRPAVDPMLRSLSSIYGPRILVAVLTGMGSDGLKGGREVVAQGGTVIAQDEASSVVWGMPGAVATAGICSSVLPLNDLQTNIVTAFMGGRP
ncbi:MAG TPA: chemotaxis response regulator protein-glutamate methylesterase [Magnetospirillaceae bacterium]|jgi:two-component system chemotaxis response regulator CheB